MAQECDTREAKEQLRTAEDELDDAIAMDVLARRVLNGAKADVSYAQEELRIAQANVEKAEAEMAKREHEVEEVQQDMAKKRERLREIRESLGLVEDE